LPAPEAVIAGLDPAIQVMRYEVMRRQVMRRQVTREVTPTPK